MLPLLLSSTDFCCITAPPCIAGLSRSYKVYIIFLKINTTKNPFKNNHHTHMSGGGGGEGAHHLQQREGDL
jgi:hypothetical protein